MPDRQFGFDTLCLHAGQIPDAATGARALPIYQTTSFVFDSADHAASLFNLQTFGNVYSRISQSDGRGAGGARRRARRRPRSARRRHRHGGADGRAAHARAATATTSSPRARCMAARTRSSRSRSRNSASRRRSSTPTIRKRSGRRSRPNTKAIYAETIGNPQLNVCDIAALAEDRARCRHTARDRQHARVARICAGRSSTAPTSSSTRSPSISAATARRWAAIVVESGKFPWDNGNFPQMTEPSRGYHGVRFFETFGDFGFTMKARMETMRTLGPTLSPLSAFLLLQGIETLHVRMPRHCESALAVAQPPRRASGGRVGQLPAARRQPLRGAFAPLSAAAARAASSRSASARRRGARPARNSSRPCSCCRISPTSATRRRSSSIRRRRRIGNCPRTSSAQPACRRK